MVDILGVFDNVCNIRANRMIKTISLRCPQNVMPALAEAVARFDVPPAMSRDVELTAYFLVTSDKPEAAGAPVPPELDTVVKQVRSLFALKNFYLLDTLQIRAGSGSGRGSNVTGQVGTPGSPSQPTLTEFRIGSWLAREDKGDVVSIQGLRAGLRVPVPTGKETTYMDTGVNLDKIDIPVGQKVVIGRSSIEGPGKGAHNRPQREAGIARASLPRPPQAAARRAALLDLLVPLHFPRRERE